MVLLVGALIAIALQTTYRRELTDGQNRAAILARLLEEQTIRNFQSVDLVLRGMADIIRSANPPANDQTFRSNMRARLAELPQVRALFVIGADGFITHDTDYPETPRVTLADRDYFKVHQNNPAAGLHISTPLMSRSVGRWFVSVSRRIDGSDGSFNGIVVAAVEPAFYSQFYQALEFGPLDAVALLHADGTLIARVPEKVDTVGKNLRDLPLFGTHLPKSTYGTFEGQSLADNQKKVMVSYRAVSGFPLVIVVALNRDGLLANWRSIALVGAFTFILIAALALVTAFVVRQRQRDRQEAERRAMASDKLQTLGRMTAGIAHDFNNVLMAIGAGVKLAEKNASDPAKMPRYLSAVHDVVERGTDLATRLLTFAKRQQLEPSVADANALLRRLAPMLRQAAGSGVSIDFNLAPGILLCHMDEGQFDAALLNLVINARDAMQNAGIVTIATSDAVESGMTPEKAGPYVSVRVRDNGPGIAPDIADKIFEPFFTTKGDNGTGLGLSQVYGGMQQIGGDARVHSKPGEGTTIELLFRRLG